MKDFVAIPRFPRVLENKIRFPGPGNVIEFDKIRKWNNIACEKIYLEQKPVEEKEYWYPMLIKL